MDERRRVQRIVGVLNMFRRCVRQKVSWYNWIDYGVVCIHMCHWSLPRRLMKMASGRQNLGKQRWWLRWWKEEGKNEFHHQMRKVYYLKMRANVKLCCVHKMDIVSSPFVRFQSVKSLSLSLTLTHIFAQCTHETDCESVTKTHTNIRNQRLFVCVSLCDDEPTCVFKI